MYELSSVRKQDAIFSNTIQLILCCSLTHTNSLGIQAHLALFDKSRSVLEAISRETRPR